MPASVVEALSLQAKPVEQTTEFVATLKSRRSATIQPQVEGFITRIGVRSGDRVTVGVVLFEVDSGPQQAILASQESMQAMRAAEVEYAQQQATRTRKLFEAGAASQRDAEDADTALRTGQAQLKAASDQVQQQRAELSYYKITSPVTGVVGDIPVRLGDRVTNSTTLTTVDENDALEIYVSVPVAQANQLKTGLPVRIVDDAGNVLATNGISFVSSGADEATQTVLAKARLVDGRGKFRSEQFIRVEIVWRKDPGLTVPVTAVTRVNGQYFAFVAETSDHGLVAKQRAVKLGEIIGNEYVVLEGLKPGDQLIISGLQKIGDGAPVSIAAASPAPQKGS
jgi:RND family efflux transporter MFP subunit